MFSISLDTSAVLDPSLLPSALLLPFPVALALPLLAAADALLLAAPAGPLLLAALAAAAAEPQPKWELQKNIEAQGKPHLQLLEHFIVIL